MSAYMVFGIFLAATVAVSPWFLIGAVFLAVLALAAGV